MDKIAIIGGGMAGLSAAYALSKPELKGRFDITVFQMGWRLGGKCATGRGPFERIEEHGIHGFLGAYYNTLSMMEDVYEKWSPNPSCPIPTYDKAFIKKNTGLHWERDGGVLKRWPKWTPRSTFTLDMVRGQQNLLLMWLGVYSNVLRFKLTGVPQDNQINKLALSPEMASVSKLLTNFESHVSDLIAQKADLTDRSKMEDSIDFWRSINPFINRQIRHSTNNDDAARRNLLEIEMFQVILRGIRDDEIMFDGFQSIDNINFKEWLEKHGASINLIESPVVSYIVNLTFQFPNGDISLAPKMSASSYLQWALRSGTYIDKSLYLFAAGTGETIITPLYKYLKDRGVKFKFFHELTDIKTDKTGGSITELTLQEQAKFKSGKDYLPVRDIKGLLSWPSQPDLDQLADGQNMHDVDFEEPNSAAFGSTINYPVGTNKDSDFAKVILAIPPAAIVQSAPSLMRANRHWHDRVGKMPTTATQAMQLWFKQPIEFLAGMPPQINNGKVEQFYYGTANFPGEMHGELDFTKYIDFEDWGEEPPQGLLYGCGVMVDPPELPNVSIREAGNLRAFETTRTMLTLMGADLLPVSVEQIDATINPHALDFSDLYVHASSEHKDARGQNRLIEQYFRGNVYPSDRYTQSPPSTKSMRINPLYPGLENMTGAGDWVDTGLNVGSVECTVMGGLLAAAFINDKNDALSIIGAWVTPSDSLLKQ